MVGEQRVICVQHLPGAREVLRMETWEDVMGAAKVGNAMSATRRNCLAAGLTLDADVIEQQYGMTKETMRLFVPVECPRMCLTKNGVLRPWTNDVCLGRKQARLLTEVLYAAFWQAVEAFSRKYALAHRGERYAQADMIEAFCHETGTSDVHVDALRRQWQRQQKRKASA